MASSDHALADGATKRPLQTRIEPVSHAPRQLLRLLRGLLREATHACVGRVSLLSRIKARQIKLRQLIAQPGERDLTYEDTYIGGRDDRPYSLARARARQAALLAAQAVKVATPHGPLRLASFGRRSVNRAATLLTKEPETIAWIDAMPADAVLWDVGANIGIYSLYAGKRGLRVVAIEPSAVNYWLLSANIELNDLQARVMALPFGLESRDGIEPLLASQFQAAVAPGFRRRKDYVPRHASQSAPILRGSTLLELGAPFPSHIKIDVMSVTTEVLEGLAPLLDDPRLSAVQIEVGHSLAARRRCAERLLPYGLTPRTDDQPPDRSRSKNLVFSRERLATAPGRKESPGGRS